MPFRIQYYPEVFADLEALSDEEFEEVDNYIEKLKTNPLYICIIMKIVAMNKILIQNEREA